jgi:hypothetical protein
MRENIDLSEYSSVDESRRLVAEADYTNCWETAPLSAAEYTISVDGYGKKTNLVGNMANLNFPRDLEIQNNALTFDVVLELVKKFESLNLSDKALLEKKIANFVGYFLFKQIKLFNELASSGKINQLFPQILQNLDEFAEDEAELHGLLSNFMKYNVDGAAAMKLIRRMFAEKNSDSISALLTSVNDAIRTIDTESDPNLLQLVKNYDQSLALGLRPNNIGLHPHPAIWHDDWPDARFRGGRCPAGIVIPTIPTMTCGGDQDAPALLSLYRKGREYISYEVFEQEGMLVQNEAQKSGRDLNLQQAVNEIPIYAPPNMSNLYLFKVPALTPSMENTVGKGNYESLREGDQDIAVIVTSRPDRLNPTKSKAEFDRKFGEGRWVLLQQNGDGELFTLRTKMDAQTLAKPRKYPNSDGGSTNFRSNVPLPANYHEAFS